MHCCQLIVQKATNFQNIHMVKKPYTYLSVVWLLKKNTKEKRYSKKIMGKWVGTICFDVSIKLFL